MSEYYKSNTARASGIVMGAISLYLAITTDNTLLRLLFGYAALEGVLGAVTREYHPLTSRILHTLRIIK